MKEDVEDFHHTSLPKPVPITEQVWPEGTRPLVSIACITYNHGKYIRDAIEGFLMQKTTFPVEILIHDDASQDKTADIIKGYENKYPQLIKPIYQVENQYSKGNSPGIINRERAEGKYFGMCEGDDYWINPLKLQKQVEVLENNKNTILCCHSAYEINCRTGKKKIICRNLNHDGILPTKDVISNRGGYIPTASILFRNDNYDELYEFIQSAPVGDFFLQSYLALAGNIFFLDIEGCVYRRNLKNSWTDRQSKRVNKAKYYNKMFKSIDQFYLLNANKKNAQHLLKPLVHYLISYVYSQKTRRKKLIELYRAIQSVENMSKVHILLESLKHLYYRSSGHYKFLF